LRFRTT